MNIGGRIRTREPLGKRPNSLRFLQRSRGGIAMKRRYRRVEFIDDVSKSSARMKRKMSRSSARLETYPGLFVCSQRSFL